MPLKPKPQISLWLAYVYLNHNKKMQWAALVKSLFSKLPMFTNDLKIMQIVLTRNHGCKNSVEFLQFLMGFENK